jgi:hypothetical protein
MACAIDPPMADPNDRRTASVMQHHSIANLHGLDGNLPGHSGDARAGGGFGVVASLVASDCFFEAVVEAGWRRTRAWAGR